MTFESASRAMPKSWASAACDSGRRSSGPWTWTVRSSRAATSAACIFSAASSPSATGSWPSSLMRAHLTLGAPRQLSDRVQVPADDDRLAAVAMPQRLLRRARVQHGREQGLGDGVVQVARDSVPLLRGALVLVELSLGQLPG